MGTLGREREEKWMGRVQTYNLRYIKIRKLGNLKSLEGEKPRTSQEQHGDVGDHIYDIH